jgi:cytochrome P450
MACISRALIVGGGIAGLSAAIALSRIGVACDVVELKDATIPAGARVMLLYGAANRDERHYRDPDRFDVTRDARDHLAWGTGPHMCAGMNLARIEMEVLLEALVEAKVALTAGVAEPGNNAGLLGFSRLPLRLDPI